MHLGSENLYPLWEVAHLLFPWGGWANKSQERPAGYLVIWRIVTGFLALCAGRVLNGPVPLVLPAPQCIAGHHVRPFFPTPCFPVTVPAARSPSSRRVLGAWTVPGTESVITEHPPVSGTHHLLETSFHSRGCGVSNARFPVRTQRLRGIRAHAQGCSGGRAGIRTQAGLTPCPVLPLSLCPSSCPLPPSRPFPPSEAEPDMRLRFQRPSSFLVQR